MKFMRRPDIDTVARVHIAAQAFLSLGVYGEITRIAKCYRVSRLFIYTLLWPLMLPKITVPGSLTSTKLSLAWQAVISGGAIETGRGWQCDGLIGTGVDCWRVIRWRANRLWTCQTGFHFLSALDCRFALRRSCR